ncbi:hypothetical protein BGW80DRAFT_1366046 [Lactifluus volemus]|nr:hypothetical protein BGW80DRAFT_1366046 [Lactifluus volemus]
MARCQYCIISPDARRGHGRASDVVCSTTNVDECRPPYNKSRPNPWVDQPLDIMKISMKRRSRCPTGPVASVSLIWARPGADLFDGHLTMTRLLNCLSLRVPCNQLRVVLIGRRRAKTALSQSLPLSSMLPRSTSRRGWNLEKREKQEKEREDVKGVEERMNDPGRDVKNEREEQISKCLRNMATIRRGKRKSRPDKGPSIGLGHPLQIPQRSHCDVNESVR